MTKLKKYQFTTITKSGSKKTYRKDDHELTVEEHEILYQQLANAWDWAPMKAKNKFMKWLRESLQERQDKLNKISKN